MTKHLRTFRTSICMCIGMLFNYAYGQVQTPRYVSMTALSNGYYEYLPQGYSSTGITNYPLLIFVHGVGELGDGSPAQLPAVLNNGTPRQISQGIFPTSFTVNGQTFRYIVISPQFTAWPGPININDIITYAKAHYKVDSTRMYLTGLSMGGGVVWDYVGSSDTYARKIAAVVPICGASFPDVARCNIIANADVAVWGTHNDADPTVPSTNTIGYVTNIDAAPNPPSPLAKKTIFASASHDAWTKTYDLNFRENNLNVYEWMLQFQRSTGALPVTGLSFNILDNAGAVQLKWQTFTEINVRGFELQRSADGNRYDSIGFVTSRASNSSGAIYDYTDRNPLHGRSYYRIKVVDNSGQITYSQVRTINIGNKLQITVYPNPVIGQLNIRSVETITAGKIFISNSNGQLLKYELFNGNNASVDVNELPSGYYTVVIKSNDDETRISFIKK